MTQRARADGAGPPGAGYETRGLSASAWSLAVSTRWQPNPVRNDERDSASALFFKLSFGLGTRAAHISIRSQK